MPRRRHCPRVRTTRSISTGDLQDIRSKDLIVNRWRTRHKRVRRRFDCGKDMGVASREQLERDARHVEMTLVTARDEGGQQTAYPIRRVPVAPYVGYRCSLIYMYIWIYIYIYIKQFCRGLRTLYLANRQSAWTGSE
ncbi:hypothetical protein M433DRAFT_398145 [Acidomyces richmondensis BFW]|nr:hypothetical protein M433DRAFT_398145 [Acidomyces richmondensis BFW]